MVFLPLTINVSELIPYDKRNVVCSSNSNLIESCSSSQLKFVVSKIIPLPAPPSSLDLIS